MAQMVHFSRFQDCLKCVRLDDILMSLKMGSGTNSSERASRMAYRYARNVVDSCVMPNLSQICLFIAILWSQTVVLSFP